MLSLLSGSLTILLKLLLLLPNPLTCCHCICSLVPTAELTELIVQPSFRKTGYFLHGFQKVILSSNCFLASGIITPLFQSCCPTWHFNVAFPKGLCGRLLFLLLDQSSMCHGFRRISVPVSTFSGLQTYSQCLRAC